MQHFFRDRRKGGENSSEYGAPRVWPGGLAKLRANPRAYLVVFLFLFLYRVSNRYFTEAHSRMTASSLGMVLFNSCSSTTPSASVLAMLSSAAPTSFIRLEITKNSFSLVCCGSGILNATLPACDSRTSRGSKFFKSTQIRGSRSAGMGRSPLSQYIRER